MKTENEIKLLNIIKKDRSELKHLKQLEKKVIKLIVKREKLDMKLKKLFEKTEDGVI